MAVDRVRNYLLRITEFVETLWHGDVDSMDTSLGDIFPEPSVDLI